MFLMKRHADFPLLKKSVVKVKNISYFVDTKGRAVKGWNEYKNKMYYSYSNGKCAVNTKIDGIKFNKNGAADLTQAREMLEAKKVYCSAYH